MASGDQISGPLGPRLCLHLSRMMEGVQWEDGEGEEAKGEWILPCLTVVERWCNTASEHCSEVPLHGLEGKLCAMF